MSTHALIAMANPNGTYQATSVHYDGDLQYMGNLMRKHYCDPDKVNSLIQQGDYEFLSRDGDLTKNRIKFPTMGTTALCAKLLNGVQLGMFYTGSGAHHMYLYIRASNSWMYVSQAGEFSLLCDALEEDQ